MFLNTKVKCFSNCRFTNVYIVFAHILLNLSLSFILRLAFSGIKCKTEFPRKKQTHTW